MAKLLLLNVYLYLGEDSNNFSVDIYKIYPSKNLSISQDNFRHHTQNAFVEFTSEQSNSVLFKDGVFGDKYKPRKRKLIDDIVVVGSLLTGWNWGLYSRMKMDWTQFPVIANPYLENIELDGKSNIELAFQNAISTIKNADWQKQFDYGTHLRMLLNNANLINAESRFLSNMVIWEWLYPHLKNPKGATPIDESQSLNDIMNYILNRFWPDKMKFKSKNIFPILRNQLAHSGKIPIDRTYADKWMTTLNWHNQDGVRGIRYYLHFFDKLTQVVVLKTLKIDAENILLGDLNLFLQTGQL